MVVLASIKAWHTNFFVQIGSLTLRNNSISKFIGSILCLWGVYTCFATEKSLSTQLKVGTKKSKLIYSSTTLRFLTSWVSSDIKKSSIAFSALPLLSERLSSPTKSYYHIPSTSSVATFNDSTQNFSACDNELLSPFWILTTASIN